MEKCLNDITADELTSVCDLSALFFTPKEISLQMELRYSDVIEAMEDESSGFYQQFYKGRLQSEVELRKSVIKLAKSGSSPAQTMAMDILNKSKVKMLEK